MRTSTEKTGSEEPVQGEADREHAYAAGSIGLDDLTDAVASLYAYVAHGDTLSLRRRMVIDSSIEG